MTMSFFFRIVLSTTVLLNYIMKIASHYLFRSLDEYQYNEKRSNIIILSLFNEIFQVIMMYLGVTQILCSRIAFWNIFILYITNILYLLKSKLICMFLSIGIFFFGNNQIAKLCIFLIYSLIYSRKLRKISKQTGFGFKADTILMIIIQFLFIIAPKYYRTIDEPNDKRLVLTIMLLENTKYVSIEHSLNSNDILWGVGLGCENSTTDQERSYVDKNIDISQCFFSRSSKFSGRGGVIYIDGGTYSMKVYCSMFYFCSAIFGGAIHFNSRNTDLKMICSNKCSASYDHFAYLKSSLMNLVEHLSISTCSLTQLGSRSICFAGGTHKVDNTNSSMNNAAEISGMSISSSSFTSTHCTFSNNKVSNNVCIQLHSISGTISMEYANIIHNNSPSVGIVCIYGVGSKKMLFCVFQNNHDYLFCVWEGSLEVSHSFISHSALSFSSQLAVATATNNSNIIRITYQINFFHSLYCNADIPIPQRSLEKTNDKTIWRTYNSIIDMNMFPIFFSYLIS